MPLWTLWLEIRKPSDSTALLHFEQIALLLQEVMLERGQSGVAPWHDLEESPYICCCRYPGSQIRMSEFSCRNGPQKVAVTWHNVPQERKKKARSISASPVINTSWKPMYTLRDVCPSRLERKQIGPPVAGCVEHKKFTAFNEARMYITVFTRFLYRNKSWATRILNTTSRPISLRLNVSVILSSTCRSSQVAFRFKLSSWRGQRFLSLSRNSPPFTESCSQDFATRFYN